MANHINVASVPTGQGLPIPYLTAVWAGVPMDEILAGLAAGTILAPPGAPGGWRPPGAEAVGERTGDPSSLQAEPPAAIASASQQGDKHLHVTDDAAQRAQVIDLRGKTGTELAELAKTDIGYRYALEQMQPFARVGNRNLYAAVNADGHLDRFDPDTGEALLSDAWLADRGKFMAWRTAEIAGADTSLAGAQGWTFIDHGQVGTDGTPLVVNLQGTDTAVRHQVIFGNSATETLHGGTGTDRIYGGGGDDTLRGGAGADHLEGGDGNDVVLGGAGNDQLLGNRGADELDGGGGRDVLAGGSGDDVLAGGGGDDRLDGGIGRDVYEFDTGDGRDIVTDTDGRGEIVIDGIALSGSMARTGDVWTSADGRYAMHFAGDAGNTGTLTIRSTAAAASAADSITIEAWTNGDLGIALDGLDDAALHPATEAPADNAPAFNVTTDALGLDAALTPSIHYGDNAPYQGTSSGTGPADVATAPNSPSAAGDGSAQSTEAPGEDGSDSDGAGAGSFAEAFDFDTALASLLGPQDSTFDPIDPARMQQAVDAFSGVVEPPDIPLAAVAAAGHGASAALTDADIADALASNSADYDADEVAATDVPWRPPEWLQTEAIAQQSDGRVTAPWPGSSAPR
ncbi:MAG: hypothetical protein ABIO63_00045 [Casimicrobiaceae bacterium]